MLGANTAGEDVLSTAYNAYLKTEETTGDPSRITYMFERALAALPRREQLWVRYSGFVEETLKVRVECLQAMQPLLRTVI